MKNLVILSILLAFLSSCSTSVAKDKKEEGYQVLDPIRLYEGPAPVSEDWVDNEMYNENAYEGEDMVINVTNPTITAYLPDPERATGAAMIVCPGGGYMALAIKCEGYNVAEWLAEHGIAAFVLKYRLNKVGDTPEEVDKTWGRCLGEWLEPDLKA